MCYGLYDENNIVGFISVLHQPHPVNKKIKRISRMVMLPEYQGIGIGFVFLKHVAKIYKNKGYDVSLMTSHKSLITAMSKSEDWTCTRYGYISQPPSSSKIDGNRQTRSKVKTCSFMFK